MINLLIVEDSPTVCEFLIHILSSDPEISVIGTASNGEEALAAVKKLKPNVITMDINMPELNGFEATRKIMETQPTPIIIVSGYYNANEVATTFKAMESGALAVVQRPKGIGHPDYEATANDLIKTVKLMSEVKVIRRWETNKKSIITSPTIFPLKSTVEEISQTIKIVAIGVSTGGPPLLQNIISALTQEFPVPILIVQHIAVGFINGLIEWLKNTSKLVIHLATNEEHILPGHIYFAPNGFNMGVNNHNKIILQNCDLKNNICPSASYLFKTVAEVYEKNALGILLTGMGKDGAEELKLIKEKGGITIAQDKESSVVFGMPQEAIKLNAVKYVFSPEKIIEMLKSLVKKNNLV